MKFVFLFIFLFPLISHSEAPVIWSGNGDYAQSIAAGGFEHTSGRLLRDCGSTDPSAGGGVAASEGSLCQYDAGVTGSLFVKSGAADTAWTNVLTSLTGWSISGNAGTTEGTNFLGTTDAQGLAIKVNNADAMRIQSDGDIGIGTTAPTYPFTFKTASDSFGDGFALEGFGAGSSRFWEFFPSAAGFLYLRNPGASFSPMVWDNVGRVGVNDSSPDVALDVNNQASRTSDATLRASAIASQTGDLFQAYDAGESNKLAYIDVLGNIYGTNLSGTNTGDVTIGTANGLSLVGQALSLGLSSTSTTGALSDTDWDTFNNKQAAGNYITDLTGDVTATGPGSVAATIANNAVSDAKFRQSAGLSVVGRSANSTGDVADITAASDNQIFRRSGTSIGFGSIDLSQSNTVGSSVLTVPNGGTGAATFTSNAPLIGAGAGAISVGSRSGNTTTFGTTSGTLTSGDCVEFDANGNLVASGSACGGSGGGLSLHSGISVGPQSNCNWSVSAAGGTFTDLGADNDCSAGYVTLGAASSPATNVPGYSVTNWAAGTYLIVVEGTFRNLGGYSNRCRVSDGTESSFPIASFGVDEASNANWSPGSSALITFSTTATRQIEVQCEGGSNEASIRNDGSQGFGFKMTAYEVAL